KIGARGLARAREFPPEVELEAGRGADLVLVAGHRDAGLRRRNHDVAHPGARGRSACRHLRVVRRIRLAQQSCRFAYPRDGEAHVGIPGARRGDQLVERGVAVERPPFHAYFKSCRPFWGGSGIFVRHLHRGPLVIGADRRAAAQKKSQRHEKRGLSLICCLICCLLFHCAPARGFLRRATTTKKSGTKIVAMKVAASIPPTTPVPMERRAPAPAPVAIMSGSTPRTKASEGITMGRKRSRAALSAASAALLPSRNPCWANSTIRSAVFAARPISPA